MKIIFLTNSFSLNSKNIYTDLVHELINEGHEIYVLAPNDQAIMGIEILNPMNNLSVISFKTGKYYNVGFLTKLKNFLLLPLKTNFIINKYLPKIQYDLLIYHSPPITFYFSVNFLKRKRTIKKTFLLQKDFFPQNAVDLRLFSKFSLPYLVFRFIEKKYIKISDFIGVMSPANKDYLLKSNSFYPENKVILFPNTKKMSNFKPNKPLKPKFPIRIFFGGNVGLPQDVDLFIQVLNTLKNDFRFLFVVSGRGNQKYKISEYIKKNNVGNIEYYEMLSNEEYLRLLETINISLVTLNYRFSIPNYPSRILDFIDYYIPILFSVDESTDLHEILKDYKIGFYSKSNNYMNIVTILLDYENLISNVIIEDFVRLKLHFDAKQSTKIISLFFKD